MKRINRIFIDRKALFAGLLVALLTFALTTGIALAGPNQQGGDDDHSTNPSSEDCQNCHIDIAGQWSHSPHAHAFDDPVFQERWAGLGEPGECLLCHTTDYQASSGEYVAEGVDCAACHGQPGPDHPPAVVPIEADTEFCGTCHTTTLGEWRRTGHAHSDVGCMDCHDPHSQGELFENPDDLCINCHRGAMEEYLEDLHVQKGIGCVDCHALVIPPDVIPDDGIVPTGHAFTITPATCVACHTDALHAGFSLPGYENGAAQADTDEPVDLSGFEDEGGQDVVEEETTDEQTVQALQAALASRNIATLFQGGIVGLVLGSTTAWFVANNIRRQRAEQKNGEEDGRE